MLTLPLVVVLLLLLHAIPLNCEFQNYYVDPRHIVHMQTFHGVVGAENFTYYKLSVEGRAIVRLRTLKGDADLYVSTDTMRPDWFNYTMKSTTCGEDEVVIEPHEPRPLGVGVYGYVVHPKSEFQLSVYLERSSTYATLRDKGGKSYSIHNENRVKIDREGDAFPVEHHATTDHVEYDEDDEDGDHIGQMRMWTIFIAFLQVLTDIL